MSKDKETTKLVAEELSKRTAPLGTPIYTDVPDETTQVPTRTGDLGTVASPIDQPGNSDEHRDKPFWKSEV